MPAQQPNEYSYDLPEGDDCWHLDEPQIRSITKVTENLPSTDPAKPYSYKRVGINARKVWNDATGKGVKVVVLDNGVEHRHPSLKENIELEMARDFDYGLQDQGRSHEEGGRITNRYNAHGTACAGLISADHTSSDPNNRIRGVAPRAKLIPIRISTNFEIERLKDALEYAASIGDVILLPRYLPNDHDPDNNNTLTKLIQEIAAQKPVICAAGNDGTDSLVHPACLDETIAVGACNDRGYRSTYSQYGENLDVVAPSNDLPVEEHDLTRFDSDEASARVRERIELAARLENKPLGVVKIPTLLPDMAALHRAIDALKISDALKEELKQVAEDEGWNLDKMGLLSIATTDNLGDFGYNFEPAGDYCNATGDFGFGGTSAAAAQVAGVVALMLSVDPALEVEEIRSILRDTANEKCLTDKSGGVAQKRSDEFGSGLVDAWAAVEKVKARQAAA